MSRRCIFWQQQKTRNKNHSRPSAPCRRLPQERQLLLLSQEQQQLLLLPKRIPPHQDLMLLLLLQQVAVVERKPPKQTPPERRPPPKRKYDARSHRPARLPVLHPHKLSWQQHGKRILIWHNKKVNRQPYLPIHFGIVLKMSCKPYQNQAAVPNQAVPQLLPLHKTWRFGPNLFKLSNERYSPII